MVIEANRVGKLAPDTKSNELMSVALNRPVVKPLMEGIKQAMIYALENGVAVAAVTDGNTWLFFKASRTDGKKPLQGKGILFPRPRRCGRQFRQVRGIARARAGYRAPAHRAPQRG